MKKKTMPAFIALLIICVAAGAMLAVVYNVTEQPIAKQQEENLMNACRQMLPAAETFNATEKDGFTYYEGLDAAGSCRGYVAINTVMGFGGEIELIVGSDLEGTLTGLQVGGANFSETAGLGAKTKEPAFTDQFAGKAYPVELVKNGGEIDAVTAATISSTAVVNGVNDTMSKLADAGCIVLDGQPAAEEAISEQPAESEQAAQ